MTYSPIQDRVDDGNVQAQDDDDGLSCQELPRSREGHIELRLDAHVLAFIQGAHIVLASQLGQALGALTQEVGRVRLRQQQDTGEGEDAREDAEEAEYPAPPC